MIKHIFHRIPLRSFNYKFLNQEAAILEKSLKMKELNSAGDIRKFYMDSMRPKLSQLQFSVAFEHGTEPPFKNEFFDHKEEGIYCSIASGVPLFSSKDKFDSGTGWPSFTKPLEDSHVLETVDRSYGMVRTEVSCSKD